MKLVTYSEPGKQTKTRPGLLWGNRPIDLQDIPSRSSRLEIKISKRVAKLSGLSSTLDLVASGAKAMEDLQKLSWRIFNRLGPEKMPRTVKNLTEVSLRPPIPRPPVLRDFYSFEDHVKAARARRGLQIPSEWYDFPAFYYSHSGRVYGPGDDVPESEAESFIAGYTIMNDWSARDIQEKEMKIGLGPAKAKDFATSLGPWIVTPDELQDKKAGLGRFDLSMKARVNGKQLSNGNMKSMHWTFPQMIARASQSVEVHPGEVFGSGTVGTGSILELGTEVHRWLRPGDEVELEIERLGVLRNRIIQSSKS